MAGLYFKVGSDVDKVVKLREEISRLKTELSSMNGSVSPDALKTLEIQLGKNTKEFNTLVAAAAQAGASMEQNFKKKIYDSSTAVNVLSNKITDQRIVIRDVESDVRKLTLAYRGMDKSSPNRNALLLDLNSARKALQEEKNTLFGLQMEQANSRLSVKKLRDEYALYKDDSKGVVSANNGMGVSFNSIFASIGGAYAIKSLMSEITSVTGMFQKYESVLTNALKGNSSLAKQYMGEIAIFAAETNFQLDELTDNFIKLVNRGITPSMASLTKLGDFTNSVAKPFAQLNEAILDINNPERWKEFGVQVSTEGQKVNLTFRGMKIEADRTVESVMKAIESFGSMEGVAGTTKAMAGTIEGQLSNLQDTFTTVFNEIGQKQEGLISEGIELTSTLVQNYETIGKVLISLVATYGAYRTAMILTAATSKGYTVVQLAQYNTLLLAERAQKLLNATMLNNPYVLLGTLIGALVAKMILFNDEQEKTLSKTELLKKITDSYSSELAKEKSELSLLLSVAKNEKVSKEGRLDAIQKLNEISPKYLGNLNLENINTKLAADAVDQYTMSLEKNAKTKAIVAQMQEIEEGKLKNAQRLTELAEKEAGKNWFDKGVDWLNEAAYNMPVGAKGSSKPSIIANREETIAIQENNKELDKKYQLLIDINSENERGNRSGVVIPKNIQLEAEKKNLEYLEQEHAKLVEQINNTPIGLVVDPLTKTKLESFVSQIKETKDKIDGLSKTDQSPIQNKAYWEEQKKSATTALEAIGSAQRKLLDDGKIDGIDTTVVENYKKQSELLKKAQKELNIYDTTGQTTKETDKLLKTQSDLSRAILESELKLQAGRISAMEEGKAKRLRLAKQEYDEALKQINDNEKEQLSKPEVTKSQKIQISDNASSLRLVEQEKLLKANTDIEKDYAKQIESIQSEVDSRFRTQLENRLVEIENYYKTQLKIAKEAGEVEEGEFIQMLLKKKTAETEYAKKENALSNLEFNEKTEVGQLENRSSGVYFVEEAEREKTEILRKYALERIALLESMGDEQSLKDAQLLQNTIDGYDKALSKPKTKSVNKMVDEKAIIALQKHFVKLGDAEDVAKEKAEKFAEGFKGKMQMVSDVAGILKESFGGISDELDMALDAVGNIAQGFAEGGLVGGISAAAGQVLSMVGNLLTAKKEIDKSMVEGYENYMDAINDLIDTQVALLDKLGGMAFGQNVINTTKDIAKSIAASRTLLTEAMSAGSGMFSHSDGYKANKMLAGYKSELREIGIYTTDLNRMSNEQLASLKKLPEVYARLPEDLRKYIDAIAEGIDKTEEFKQQVQDTILGLDFTSMADMIVDSLTDPSIDNALGDFEKNIDKTLASIIKNMLRRNILLTPLEKMMSDLYKSMETGKKDANGNPVYELTSGAAKSFKDNVLGLGKQFQDAWKVLEESFGSEGIDLMPKEEYKEKEDNTLKGAYAKASQESIDLLAGQTGAQRVAVESIREQMQFIRDLQVKGWKDVSDIKDLAGKIDKNSEQVAENTRQIKEVADKVADNTKKTAEVLDGGTINVNIKGM